MSDQATSQSVGACPACGANVFAGDRFCGGCGSAATVAAEAELLMDLQQVTLGEYEILGILGRGGMGLVFVANDLSLNRKVAIKVLPPFLLTGEAAVERFRREARTAGSLRHRNITSVYGLRETTRIVFFVMEYVEGRTLDALLQSEGWMGAETAEALLHDVAGALSYAHRREIVHRDLKPSNILVDTDGMAIVSDFGVAKTGSSHTLTATGSTVGSPKYMSPEQWSGRATAASDQYALGCVAYEMLAGRAPFLGEAFEELMRQHLFDAPEPLGELRPDCRPAVTAGIMRMLAKDPAVRFESIDAAIAAMELRAVPADEPVRRALAGLAREGQQVSALPRTPRSPIPVSQMSRGQGAAAPAAGARVPIEWAVVAGVVPVMLAIAGYLFLGATDGARDDAAGDFEAAVAGDAGTRRTSGAVVPDTLGVTSAALGVAPPGNDPDERAPAPRVTPAATVSRPQVATRESTSRPEREPTGISADVRRTETDVAAVVPDTTPRSAAVLPPAEPETPRPTAIVQLLIMPWANVLIDGDAKGQRTRWEDTLTAGVPHRLRFERAGFAPVDTTVTLEPNEQRLLRIQMLPRNP